MAADRLQLIAELIDKNVGANAKRIEKAFSDLGKAKAARDLPTSFQKISERDKWPRKRAGEIHQAQRGHTPGD